VTEQPSALAETAALVEEACRKSALLWLTLPGDRPRALWHVWHEGSAYVVTGGGEQPLPGAPEAAATGATAEITVRSKDKGVRLVSWQARLSPIEPGTERWDEVVPVLHANRLNAPDGEEQPARWARESLVVRLEPTGVVTEAPGSMAQGSHAAPPPGTPATTAVPLPSRLGRPRR
jgi:hypothetical protein